MPVGRPNPFHASRCATRMKTQWKSTGVGYSATIALPYDPEPEDIPLWCRLLNEAEQKMHDFVPRLGAWGLRGTRQRVGLFDVLAVRSCRKYPRRDHHELDGSARSLDKGQVLEACQGARAGRSNPWLTLSSLPMSKSSSGLTNEFLARLKLSMVLREQILESSHASTKWKRRTVSCK